MRHECYFCHIKTVENLIQKFEPDSDVADHFAESTSDLLYRNRKTANPYLVTQIHRLAKDMINHSNLYQNEKFNANSILLKNYDTWKNLIKGGSDPLYKAAKLAVAGNIIDYGAHTVSDNIDQQVKTLVNTDLVIDESKDLFEEIEKAKSILYLGDNAGEIVFDKLFIETTAHTNITYVVRGMPIINDVTIEDAQQTGMDKICRIISNGYDAPSTLLDLSSDELKQEFEKTDLVISKGQGNFEGLMNAAHPNLYFMLIAKCRPMAALLGVDKGGMVITKLKKQQNVL